MESITPAPRPDPPRPGLGGAGILIVEDELELVRALRINLRAPLREWYHAPIIVLSGRTSPGDKIGALGVGADDYVTKPFAMAELLARLRAVLRRDDGESGPGRARQATIGRWLVDVAAHQVRRAASDDARDTLRLTPTEWQLLEVLARNRALAVRDYLREKTLSDRTLIRVSAKGVCCYVAGNDTDEGRAANRRVEIELKMRAQATLGSNRNDRL